MRKTSTIIFMILILPFLLIAQVDKGDDTSLRSGVQIGHEIITADPPDVGSLLTNGVLVTTFPDIPGNLHPMGIAFDGTYYWRVGGGGSSGDVAQLDASFNLVATQNVALDCRGVFYNPADGEVYIKGFTNNGLYRLHTDPFDGGFDVIYTSFFQNSQSKACMSFLDGTKMYDHLDGIANEYDFASGTLLNTITLNLQHDLTWPRGNLIAHTGTYLLTYAHNVVYAYDIASGNFVSACTLATQPSSYEWSMSYTNGMFFIPDNTEATWYVWTIDQGVPVELTSFEAVSVNNEVHLNWATATETNNQGFEIERTNSDGEFLNIGFVAGFGTTTEPKSYSFIDQGVNTGKYMYRLKQIDFDGTFEYSDEISIEVFSPDNYMLSQNYPNPFNPSTVITYEIPTNSFVSLKVYDLLGKEVTSLVYEEKTAGRYDVIFDASEINSGFYIYILKADNFMSTRKMLLLK